MHAKSISDCGKKSAAPQQRSAFAGQDADIYHVEHAPPTAIMQQARLQPASLHARDVLHLQRTIGSRAVGQLLTETMPRSSVRRQARGNEHADTPPERDTQSEPVPLPLPSPRNTAVLPITNSPTIQRTGKVYIQRVFLDQKDSLFVSALNWNDQL